MQSCFFSPKSGLFVARTCAHLFKDQVRALTFKRPDLSNSSNIATGDNISVSYCLHTGHHLNNAR
jgi:hypothetical protein